VQARFFPSSTVIHEGSPHMMQLSVGNASADALDATVAADVPDGWTTGEAAVTVPSRELRDVSVDVEPGGPPGTFLVGARIDAGGRDVLVEPAEVLTTPAGQRCVLALDAGSADSPLHPGYRRLAPGHVWDPEAGFGWIGAAPQSRDRGGPDPLLRDFVNDVPTRTLRVAVPAGSYETSLLVGDDAVRSFATYVHADGELLAESRFLFRGEFEWIHFTLDGGTSGQEVDLALSSAPDEHWHLVALVIVDPTAGGSGGPPAVARPS
jgi:alpha-glucuronidase